MSKVRVNVKHDIHGMFHVQSAEMMQEVVKAPVSYVLVLALLVLFVISCTIVLVLLLLWVAK